MVPVLFDLLVNTNYSAFVRKQLHNSASIQEYTGVIVSYETKDLRGLTCSAVRTDRCAFYIQKAVCVFLFTPAWFTVCDLILLLFTCHTDQCVK